MNVGELITALRGVDPMLPTNVEELVVSPSMAHGVTVKISDATEQLDAEQRALVSANLIHRGRLDTARKDVEKFTAILRRIKQQQRARRLPV